MNYPLAATLALGAATAHAAALRIHIGTYNTRGSAGIYTAALDSDTGALSAPAVAAAATNASWVSWHPRGTILYAVNEHRGEGTARAGEVVAYAPDADGRLRERNRQRTGLGTPCHLGVDPSGGVLVAALYGDGAVLAFPLDGDGSIRPPSATIRHQGSGPHPERQKGPHAHGVTFAPGGNLVFIPDLGLDRMVAYRVAIPDATLLAVPTADGITPAGAGPRHFVFHPDGRHAYAVNELDATVTAFAWDAGRATLTPVATVRSLPADATMPNTSAEIAVHPGGRFLYVSNRGHDSIAVFALDPATGAPTLVQNEPSGGRTPRGFALDPSGRYLVSANQDSDRIVTLRVDPETGRLTLTGHAIDVPAPVCIAFPPQ